MSVFAGPIQNTGGTFLLSFFSDVFIKCWVIEIDIFLIHFLFAESQTFAKALEMNDFSFTQKTNDVVYIRIIAKPENIVIGFSRLLFCCNDIRATSLKLPMYGNRHVLFSTGTFSYINSLNKETRHLMRQTSGGDV